MAADLPFGGPVVEIAALLLRAAMEIRRLGAAMGAEIVGVDLNALSDDAFSRIRDAFHTYQGQPDSLY